MIFANRENFLRPGVFIFSNEGYLLNFTTVCFREYSVWPNGRVFVCSHLFTFNLKSGMKGGANKG